MINQIGLKAVIGTVINDKKKVQKMYPGPMRVKTQTIKIIKANRDKSPGGYSIEQALKLEPTIKDKSWAITSVMTSPKRFPLNDPARL